MTPLNVRKLALYWIETSQSDWEAYLTLKSGRNYVQSLFFMHLVIEKRLKAAIVLETKSHPSFTHSLPFLAGKLSIMTSEQILQDLTVISGFNLSTRYPDEKLAFYKLANKKYCELWEGKAKEVMLWLDKHIDQLFKNL